jgi:hypothetical protein
VRVEQALDAGAAGGPVGEVQQRGGDRRAHGLRLIGDRAQVVALGQQEQIRARRGEAECDRAADP